MIKDFISIQRNTIRNCLRQLVVSEQIVNVVKSAYGNVNIKGRAIGGFADEERNKTRR